MTVSLFAQTRDGTVRVELPQARIRSYTERLNQPGSLQAELAPRKLPDAAGDYTIPIAGVLEDGVHELGVRRDGSIVWLGACVGIDEQINADGSSSLQVAAEGLAGYLWRWMITGKLPNTNSAGHYIGVDQATIAKSLVDHHQAKGGGDYADIDTSQITATGVTRTRTEYDSWRGLNIGETLTQLAGVQNGFDWEIGPDRVMRIHYPRQGRRRTNVTLGPESILSLGRQRDATRQVSAVHGFGDGLDEATPRITRTDASSVAKYGLTEGVYSGSGISDLSVLTANTNALLDQVKTSPNLLSVEIRWSATVPYGSFGLGDELRILWPDSPWRPIDEWRRVIGIDHRPHPDETATLHLDPIGAA